MASKIQFDKRGDMLVAKGKTRFDVKTRTVLRGEGPLSVRDRLARMRSVARAQYVARVR